MIYIPRAHILLNYLTKSVVYDKNIVPPNLRALILSNLKDAERVLWVGKSVVAAYKERHRWKLLSDPLKIIGFIWGSLVLSTLIIEHKLIPITIIIETFPFLFFSICLVIYLKGKEIGNVAKVSYVLTNRQIIIIPDPEKPEKIAWIQKKGMGGRKIINSRIDQKYGVSTIKIGYHNEELLCLESIPEGDKVLALVELYI